MFYYKYKSSSIIFNSTIITISAYNEKGNGDDLLIARIVSMLVLGLVSFFLGILPFLLVKFTKLDMNMFASGKYKIILSWLLCFGAGVLLCTSFAHMLPELRESVEILQANNQLPETKESLPLAEIFVLSGLFLVYIVEELVHFIFDTHGHNHIYKNQQDLLSKERKKSMFDSFIESINGALFTLALSFHAIFEGLAVGLENNAQDVWYLMGAVAAHKFVIAFCLGLELLVSDLRKTLYFLYVFTFAMVTPLGIGIGIALQSGTETSTPATVVLEGMAAGTLIYVVFMEVLHRERNEDHNNQARILGLAQYSAVLIGFIIMLVLYNVGK